MAQGLNFDVEVFSNLNDQLKIFKTTSVGISTRLTEVGTGLTNLLGAFKNRAYIDNMEVFNTNFGRFANMLRDANLKKETTGDIKKVGTDLLAFSNSFEKIKTLDIGKIDNIGSVFLKLNQFSDEISKFGTTKSAEVNDAFSDVTTFVIRIENFAKAFGSSIKQIERHMSDEKIKKIQPIIKVMQGLLGVVKVGQHISKIPDFERVVDMFSIHMYGFIDGMVKVLTHIGTVKIPNEKNMRSILVSMVYISKYVETISKVDTSTLNEKNKQVFVFLVDMFGDMSRLFNHISGIKINDVSKLEFLIKTMRAMFGFVRTINDITKSLIGMDVQAMSLKLKQFVLSTVDIIKDVSLIFKQITGFSRFSGNIFRKDNSVSAADINKLKSFSESIEQLVKVFKVLGTQATDVSVEMIVGNLDKIRRMLSAVPIFNFGGLKGIAKSIGSIKTTDLQKFSLFAEAVRSISRVFTILGKIDQNVEPETVIRSLSTIRRMLLGIPILPFGGLKSLMRDIGNVKGDTVAKFRSFAEAVLAISRSLEKLGSISHKEIDFKGFRNSVQQLKKGMEAGGFGKTAGFLLGKDFGNQVNRGAKSAWGIRSPSTVFRDFGRNIVSGFSAGMSGLKAVIEKFAKTAIAVFKGFVNTTKTIFNGVTNVITYPFKKAADVIGGMFGFVSSRIRFALNDLRQFTGGVGSIIAGTAIEFELGLSKVFKTIEMPEDGVAEFKAKLTQEFRDLATGDDSVLSGLSGASKTILEIAEVAGTLGIGSDILKDFTETVGAMTIATNLGSQEAAAFFGQFSAITQNQEFDRIGATMVHLGNNFATTEASIADFSLRIAGAAETAGFAEKDTLALSAALGAVGFEAEAGGSAMSRVINEMVKASAGFEQMEMSTDVFVGQKQAAIAKLQEERIKFQRNLEGAEDRLSRAGNVSATNSALNAMDTASAKLNEIDAQLAGLEGSINSVAGTTTVQIGSTVTKELAAFSKAAGVSAKEFAEMFNDEPIEALNLFINGLGKLSAGDQLKILDDLALEGIRTSDALRRLGGAGLLLNRAISTANEGWNENIALMDEARIRNETVDASIQRMKNRFYDLKVTIGNVFAPVVKFVADAIGGAIQRVNVFLEGFITSINAIRNPIQELKNTIDNTFSGGGDSNVPIAGKISPELAALKALYDPALGMYQELTLAQGDSLWGIAQRYGVSVEQLREWNGLTKDSVYHYGDTIKIWSKVNSEGDDMTEMIDQQVEAMRLLEDQMKDTGKETTKLGTVTRVLGKNLTIDQVQDLQDSLKDLNKDFSDSRKAIGQLFSGESQAGVDNFAIAIGNLKESFKSVLNNLGIDIGENPFLKKISELVDDIKNKNWTEAFKTALQVPISALQVLISGGLDKIGFGEKTLRSDLSIEDAFTFERTGDIAQDTLGKLSPRNVSLFGFNEYLEERIKEIGDPENFAETIDLAILNIRKILTEIANGDYSAVETFLADNLDSIIRGGVSIGLGLIFGFPIGTIAFVSNLLATAIEKDIMGLRTELEKSAIGQEIVGAVGYIGEQINLALAAINEIVNPPRKIGIMEAGFNISNLVQTPIGIEDKLGIDPKNVTKEQPAQSSNPFVNYFNRLIADVKDIIDEVSQIDFTAITTFVSGILKFINDIVAGATVVIGSIALLELKTFVLPLIENIGKTFNTLTEEFTGDEINTLLKIGAAYIVFINRVGVAAKLASLIRFGGLQLLIGGMVEALPGLLEGVSGAFGIIEGLLSGDKDKVEENSKKALEGIKSALEGFFGYLATSSFNIMEAIGLGPADKLRIQAENSLRGIVAIVDTIITRIKIAALDLAMLTELDPNKDAAYGFMRDALVGGLAFGEQFKFSTLELDAALGFTNTAGELVATSFRTALENPQNYVLSGEAKERLRYAAINTLLSTDDTGKVNDAFNVFRLLGIDPETQLTTEQLQNLPFLKTMPTNLKDAILRNIALGELGLDQESILPFLTVDGVGGFFNTLISGLMTGSTQTLNEETKTDIKDTIVSAVSAINEGDALENALMGSVDFEGFNMLSLFAFKPASLGEGETIAIGDAEINSLVDELLVNMKPLSDRFGDELASDIYLGAIQALLTNKEDAISDEDAQKIAIAFYEGLINPITASEIDIPTTLADSIFDGLNGSIINDTRYFGLGATIGKELKDGTEDELDIRSPSGVYKEYGKNIIEGLQKGLDDNVSDLSKSVTKITDELANVSIMTAIMANKVSISLAGIILQLVVFSSTFSIATTILKLNLLTMRTELDTFIDKIEDAILALARLRVSFALSQAGFGEGEGPQQDDRTTYYGGYVNKGSRTEVLENGLPFETYRTSKGKTYLISNENGQIYSPAARTRDVNVAAGVGMASPVINEGDVYITVNGTGNAEAVAEAVVKKMEKQKARGTMRTLKLSGASGA